MSLTKKRERFTQKQAVEKLHDLYRHAARSEYDRFEMQLCGYTFRIKRDKKRILYLYSDGVLTRRDWAEQAIVQRLSFTEYEDHTIKEY